MRELVFSLDSVFPSSSRFHSFFFLSTAAVRASGTPVLLRPASSLYLSLPLSFLFSRKKGKKRREWDKLVNLYANGSDSTVEADRGVTAVSAARLRVGSRRATEGKVQR